MKNRLIHLHDWQPDLMLSIANSNNTTLHLDFNRIRYRHCPVTRQIQKGSEVLASRDQLAIMAMNTFKSDHRTATTRYGLFERLKKYLRWCDKHYMECFTKASIHQYVLEIYTLVLKGEIKKGSYKVMRTQLTGLCRLFDYPISWFDELPVVKQDDIESFEAYSQSDLKQLLPLLRAMFKQLSEQFCQDPQYYLSAHHNRATMRFVWKGKKYPIRSGVTRLMSVATYLLAYYTFCNTSTLLQLKRPTFTSQSLGDTWYSMPAFKRRAFKVLTVEIGTHKLTIPKYCIDFFDTLLRVSQHIDPSPQALLLQTYTRGQRRSITPYHFREFNVTLLGRYFPLKDDLGRPLRPIISRFRETGSLMTQIRFGDIAAAELLGNTPSVIRKHYSTGNRHSNNAMLQESASIRAYQAKHKVNTSEAKRSIMEELKIPILSYDDWMKSTVPGTLSAHGSYCIQPFGEKSKAFSRKSKQHQLTEGERLACAELLQCFGCEHQVIVQTDEDIWCLLSFCEALEESRYYHLDAHHFRKNFDEIITFIEHKILPKIHTPLLKRVRERLNTHGRHPLWQDATSVNVLGSRA